MSKQRRPHDKRLSSKSNVIPISAIGLRPTLTPCHPLSKQQREIFQLVASHNEQIRAAHAPLLTAYAIACTRMYAAKNPADFASVIMSLAMKLKITPAQNLRAEVVGRRYQTPDNGERPWNRGA
jgi:hypothetical protein